MGVESPVTSTISGLDDSWPLGNDPTLDGDNHLRLIKRVLKLVFPGAEGNGFDEAIVATEAELNYLSGATSNIQDQLDALQATADAEREILRAPNRTILMIYNEYKDPIPLGWKRKEVDTNYMLIISPEALEGVGGGTNNPVEWSHTHAQPTVKIEARHLPPHAHTLNNLRVVNDEHGSSSNYDFWVGDQTSNVSTATTGPGWGSNDPLQLPNTNSSKWEPRYVAMTPIERDTSLDEG